MKPMGLLHLIVGPWASGKTTLVPHLAVALPECVVFDWDIVIAGLSMAARRDVHTEPSTWDGLQETWVAVVESVLAGNRDVVLVGPLRPEDLPADRIAADRVRCAYLDCPDTVLSKRLSDRNETEEAIDDELVVAATFRRTDYRRIVAGDIDPERMAAEVVAWIRG